MAVSKRVRFEVLKRDSFRCQYCGAEAPSVLLHVDHIRPVVGGGGDDLTNLVTACAGCNLGKAAVRLDDDTAVQKAKRQLDELQERREQLEMMMAWQENLKDLDDEVLIRAEQFWVGLAPGFHLNPTGKQNLSLWIRKFGLSDVLEGMRTAANGLEFTEDGRSTGESWEECFRKIPACIVVERRSGGDPEVKRMYYIRGILRNRLAGRYFRPDLAFQWIEAAHSWGVSLDELQRLACAVKSWSQFNTGIGELISSAREQQEPDATDADH